MSLLRRPLSPSSRLVPLLLLTLLAACGPGPIAPEDGPNQGDADALSGVETASFQDGVAPTSGYAGTTDTTLQESTPSTNEGALTSVRLDHDYPTSTGKSTNGLLRFDLGAIPAGSTVQSVQLTLNVTNSTSGEGYFLYPVARTWSESQATWDTAASGTEWTAGGTRSSGDRGGTSLATLNPSATGAYTVALNAQGLAQVQGWVDAPSTNHGFALDANTNMDGLIFDSAEATTAAHRPRLTVSYVPPTPPAGSGTGLLGQYYSGTALQTLLLSRTDATVGFNWGAGSPAASVPVDNFSVRWTGQVQPLYSQTYTFSTSSDDGVRLWVNGQQLINNWTDHAAHEDTGSIALTAGQKYDVKLEYYEKGGQAVATLSWASPSQTKALIPASQLYPASAPPTEAALDETGATLQDTDYAIPSGAIFLATNGNDGNAGTQAAPVATLNRAISLAPSGGTIVVRGGVYRDWYNNGSGFSVSTKSLTFQAYPHEKPWFDGTDVVASSRWASDGAGHWAMGWSTPSFCNGHYYDLPYNAQQVSPNSGPCTHHDMYGDPDHPAAGDPQMIFFDGTNLNEVDSLSKLTAGSFFYDWANRRIYLATNPSGHTVELASRPMALAVTGNGSAVKGIGFRRYATNEYNNTTAGALYLGGSNTLIENAVFTQQAAQALHLVPVGAKVSRSVFAFNGFNGLGSNGHQHSTGAPDGLVIEDSIFNNNNTEHYGLHCTESCAQAGVKIAHMDGFTVKNNVFENNQGRSAGFWCDLACSHGVMINNVARNNGGDGIFYEVSDTGLIASNLVVGNAGNGIRVGSSNTKVYNNTAVDNATIDLWVYDDSRSYGVNGWTDVGPDTVGVEIVNNVFSGDAQTMIKLNRSSATAPNTGPGQFFDAFDYNSYYRPNHKILFNWTDASPVYYSSLSTFTHDHGLDVHSTDVSTGGDPFFVDAANGNYDIRSGSVAYHSGTSLPADVAAALGVSSSAGQNRGAFTWPGHP